MKHIFYFLSKTDSDIIGNCPRSARTQQITLGVFVLLTGVFAFISGSYAISTLFKVYDHTTGASTISSGGRNLSLAIGFLYSLMIMAIDREIVSATVRWARFIRIPLAVVIGLVVAVPIELKLLEDRIHAQIFDQVKAKNEPARITKNETIKTFQDQKSKLFNRTVADRDSVAKWSSIMEAEAVGRKGPGRTGKEGKGVHYEEAKRNCDLWKGFVSQDSLAYAQFVGTEKGVLDGAGVEYTDVKAPATYDFFSMFIALENLKKDKVEGASASNMSWAIRLLFIFFEVTPALMKLLTTDSEYNACLEARRRLNITYINAIANEGLVAVREDPENAKNKPRHVGEMKENIQT